MKRVDADRLLVATAVIVFLITLVAASSLDTGPPRPAPADLPDGVSAKSTRQHVVGTPGAGTGNPRITPVNGGGNPGGNAGASTPGDRRLLEGVTWPRYAYAAATAYQAADRPTGGSSFAGQVIDRQDQAIDGARVMVRAGAVSGGSGPIAVPRELDANGEFCHAAAVTDDEGMFRIDGVPTEAHLLWTEAPFHQKFEINLDGPQETLELRLSKFGIVVGTVTNSEGKPVPDFTVMMMYAAPLPGNRNVGRPAVPAVPEATFTEETTFDGPFEERCRLFRYHFTGVTNGRFAAYTGIGRFWVWVYANGTSRPHRLVTSRPDSIEAIAVTLARPTSISGRVVAADDPEVGVANALVRTRFAANNNPGATVRTEEDGSFRLELPQGGDWKLAVEHHQYLGFEQVVTLADGEAKQMTIPLGSGIVVHGVVRDPEGNPLPGQQVRITPRERAGTMLRAGGATTNGEGRYRIPGLQEGRFVISVDPVDGWLGARAVIDLKEPGLEKDLTVEGGTTLVLNVTISDGRAIPDDLRVTIALDSTVPVEERVDPLDPEYKWTPGQRFHSAVIDASGTGRIPGVFPAQYQVQVRHPQLKPYTGTITVAPGAEHAANLVLEAGRTFTGVVSDLDGNKLDGVQIFCTPEGAEDSSGTRVGRSDATGAFLVAGLEATRYKVEVMLRDFRPFDTVIDLTGGSVEQAITLDPGIVLSGQVLTPEGQPVSQGWIYLEAPSRGRFEAQPGTLIRNGEFTLGGLQPGTFNVRVSVPGYLPPDNLVVELVGGKQTMVIHMVGGASLTGRVINNKQEGVRQARVSLRRLDPGADSGGGGLAQRDPSAYTQRDGSFEVRGIQPGQYQLTVRAFDLAPYVEKLTIGSSSVTRIIELESGFTVSGVVKTRDGTPPTAYIQIQKIDAPDNDPDWLHGGSTRIDPRTGNFSMGGLLGGRYKLQVLDLATRVSMHESTIDVTRDIDGLTIKAVAPDQVSVSGTVTLADGTPAVNFFLTLASNDPNAHQPRARTDANGRFALERVVAGEYQLTATDPRGRAVTPLWPVTVQDRDVTNLDLRVDDVVSGARILSVEEGTIADRAGLRMHDIITHYDGTQIRTNVDLRRAVLNASNRGDGGVVELRYLRDSVAGSVFVEPGPLGANVR